MTRSYAGTELVVFAHAGNWKRYVARHIGVYLRGQVLEVGAGIGSATRAFCNGRQQRWVCLEPDPGLSDRAKITLRRESLNCEFIAGSLDDLPGGETFNAILYMDVLEHIAEDRLELLRASHLLQPGGVICVLAPAHPWLYSEFDKAIGHFRRYTKSAFTAMDLPGLKLERLRYLDCCGLLPSALNRVFLRSPLPTLRQIAFWDRVLVPLSRLIDPMTSYSAGKSVLAVWRRTDEDLEDEFRADLLQQHLTPECSLRDRRKQDPGKAAASGEQSIQAEQREVVSLKPRRETLPIEDRQQ